MTRSFTEQDALDAFDAYCPHIVGNPFCVHFPHPKQAELLSHHMRHDYDAEPIAECLYGGAAGGGKSDAILMAAAQYAWKFGHFRAVCLRRTHTELAKAGALMERAMSWWLGRGVAWDGTNKKFRFPSGATVEMGYHATPADNKNYQGGEWHFVAFDELTHWPDEKAWEWLRSRCRKNVDDPIPLRQYAASNPGSVGHNWVKKRFVGATDMTTGRWVEPVSPFIAAKIADNPSLDRKAYVATLSSLDPTTRDQLLHGDWDAREPGDYFREEWFGPMLAEDDVFPRGDRIAVRWWDLAASMRDDAARTAGVRMVRHRRGVRVIEHATAFRLTPGRRDARILETARRDGRDVVVGLEIEGGSGGPAQFETLSRQLRAAGFRVVGAKPKQQLERREGELFMRTPVSDDAKARRAAPVAACLERGYIKRGECPDHGGEDFEHWWAVEEGRQLADQTDGIRIVCGPWTQAYLDEVSGFPELELKDLVDATSGAWAYLEAHPFGSSVPPAQRAAIEAVELQNVHPDDRPEPARPTDNTKPPLIVPSRRRLWTP